MALVLPLIGFHPTPLRLQACLLALALACGPALAAPASGGDTPSPAGTVQVQDGDMASVLAFRLKPRGATIEQMMVALLRHNPEAFIQGNVNLLRNGAVLRMPEAEEVFRTPAPEARDTVQRHHQNFLTDLEKSVTSSPATATPPTAGVSAPQPDQAADKEALLERLRTAKTRLNELQQNIQELERLTREASEPQPQATTPEHVQTSPDIPTSWIWLGVAAIVAVMVGVGSARRPEPQAVATAPVPTDAAAEFQARLGALDLNLDAPSSPSPFPGQTR